MAKYLILTNGNKAFEYDETDLTVTLDKHIETALGFGSGFSMDQSTWNDIKNSVSGVPNKVKVINGLCKSKEHNIKKILSGYITEFEYK